MQTIAAIFVLSFLGLSNGHGLVEKWTVGSTSMPGWDFWKKPETGAWSCANGDNGFVSAKDLNAPNIICHKDASPGKKYLVVKAGDTISMIWNAWADSHKGPILTYIAPCNDCTSVKKGELKFIKIQEGGYSNGQWETDRMLKAGKISNATIPSNLKPGNYVLRHEAIALHGARNSDSQQYPQCINIRVTGSGNAVVAEGILGTKLYQPKEPGLVFDLYTKFSNYPMPGPKVWRAK
jgi:cellulase